MSAQDYNNGLIMGMAMKGLPYGKYYSWQPESVSNDDTASVTINFGRYIPDLDLEDYINALYFIKTFGCDQSVVSILGWERVDGTTIKFLLEDYFSCNGTILIAYNKLLGNIDSVPNFTYPFEPVGVPIVIYIQETDLADGFDFFVLDAIAYTNGFADAVGLSLRTPVEPSVSDSLSGCEFNIITPISLTNGFSEGTVQTVFE